MTLMKSHVLGAVNYSARVNGIPNEIVDKTRTAVRTGTSTRAAGGSAKLDLMLQKVQFIDPLFDATVLPLLEWAIRLNVAKFNNHIGTLKTHEHAWHAAIGRILKVEEDKVKVWKRVRGPACACILTLLRISCSPNDAEGWQCWKAQEDRKLNLFSITPHELKNKLRKANCGKSQPLKKRYRMIVAYGVTLSGRP